MNCKMFKKRSILRFNFLISWLFLILFSLVAYADAATSTELVALGLNAPENGIQTTNGRRFISSNGAFYELNHGRFGYSTTALPVQYLNNSSPSCYFLGITEMFGHIYTACTENNLDPYAKKHLLAMNIYGTMLQEIARLDSMALPNGVTSDGNGNLYIVDNGIILLPGSVVNAKINQYCPLCSLNASSIKVIHNFQNCKPNGIKYGNGKLYISVDPLAYIGVSQLLRYDVTSSGLDNRVAIFSTWNFLDDFILVDGGIVLAEYLGTSIVHIDNDGDVLHRATFTTPSSITFLAPPYYNYGDLLVTEALTGNVYRLINDWGLSPR
jgi:hypothetical protein